MNFNPHINKRNEDSNKGTFGRVLVIAGSENMSGCVFFCSMGALRTGCGLVNIYTHKDNLLPLKTLVPEAIFDQFDDFTKENPYERLDYLLQRADSVVIGPGLKYGEESYKLVLHVIKNFDKHIVLDAEALNVISHNFSIENVLDDSFKADFKHPLYNINKNRSLIITPHLYELSRLTKERPDMLKDHLNEFALEIAKKYGIITVLKDHNTRVSDGKDVYTNKTGNSALAKAGSGDILSGMIGSLILQDEYTFRAVNTAVYLHGKAGELAGAKLSEYSTISRDILDYISQAILTIKSDEKIYYNNVIAEVMNASFR